jgi:hypothetical protein
MARSVQSYVELQRQHITAELRQREADNRKAAVSASQAQFDEFALDQSLTKVAIAKP